MAMDKLKKLLQKMGARERAKIEIAIERLIAKDIKGMRVKKILAMNCHRVRIGRFRIFFDFTETGIAIIDIKTRNERTYKNLR